LFITDGKTAWFYALASSSAQHSRRVSSTTCVRRCLLLGHAKLERVFEASGSPMRFSPKRPAHHDRGQPRGLRAIWHGFARGDAGRRIDRIVAEGKTIPSPNTGFWRPKKMWPVADERFRFVPPAEWKL